MWFSASGNTEIAVGKCLYHGYMEGTIKVKSVGDSTDNIFVIKKTIPINRKGFERIKARERQVIEKKREREKQRKLSEKKD